MRIIDLALGAALTLNVAASGAAFAQRNHDYNWQGDQDGNWDPASHYHAGGHERRLGRDDRVYRGSDGRYYCRRGDGTTGLVIGGVSGALLGSALGGRTAGTLLGAVGGALVGQSIDRGKVRCR